MSRSTMLSPALSRSTVRPVRPRTDATLLPLCLGPLFSLGALLSPLLPLLYGAGVASAARALHARRGRSRAAHGEVQRLALLALACALGGGAALFASEDVGTLSLLIAGAALLATSRCVPLLAPGASLSSAWRPPVPGTVRKDADPTPRGVARRANAVHPAQSEHDRTADRPRPRRHLDRARKEAFLEGGRSTEPRERASPPTPAPGPVADPPPPAPTSTTAPGPKRVAERPQERLATPSATPAAARVQAAPPRRTEDVQRPPLVLVRPGGDAHAGQTRTKELCELFERRGRLLLPASGLAGGSVDELLERSAREWRPPIGSR